jgi:transporter family-2 protein
VAAHGLAATAGAAIAVQVRLNAEFGVRIGSGLVAAAVSFAGGLLVAGAVACTSPRARSAARSLKHAPAVPWWTYLGGLGGALFMTVAVLATPSLGVAVVSIAAIAGQLAGGLAADHVGLPGTRRVITQTRIVGAAVALVAVAVGCLNDDLFHTGGLGMTGVVMAAGATIAVQAALNGRLRTASSAAVATTINFVVGLAALALVLLALAVAGGQKTGPWPANPLLYTGGVLGAMVIGAMAISVAIVGVLRMTLLIVGGQLAAAAALDAGLPSGPGFNVQLLVGAALVVVAVAIVSYRPAGASTATERGLHEAVEGVAGEGDRAVVPEGRACAHQRGVGGEP